jgi:hypothetical protein
MAYTQQYTQYQPQLVHPQFPLLGMPGYQQYPLPLGAAAGGFPGQFPAQAQQQWQASAGGGGIHQPR